MKEMLYLVLDLAEHLARRGVLLYLFCGLITVKEKYHKHTGWVEAGFLLVTTAFYMAVNYLPVFKIFFYGNKDGLSESRASILPMFISLGIMLIYCFFFYDGKKSRIAYLVVTGYTLNELMMFTIHAVFSMLLRGISEWLLYLVEAGNPFVLAHAMGLFEVIQVVWNLLFQIVMISGLYLVVRNMKKNLIFGGKEPNRTQELFLALPSVMGLCFCILLRSIMYAVKDGQTRFLMEEYPETNLLVPMIAASCILLIYLSTVTLKKLVESSEQEMLVEIYQNQISDMEEHMKDVEHLYDGIRGMRHDMKNYVADLEILLKKKDCGYAEYEAEVRRYLDGMCSAVEELDTRCSTGNPVTDVVVSRKIRQAEQKGIPFSCEFFFPEAFGISAFDVSILLNNGLDNALEASAEEESPYICLASYVREQMFFVEIRNAYTGEEPACREDGLPITKKQDGALHGMGMKNIKSCAEKYYGACSFEIKEGEFRLTVMLQGKRIGKA